MSVTLGELLLEMGLSTESYYIELENARLAAIEAGQDIERALGSTSMSSVVTFNRSKLSPKVDHAELTALNQHLDQKVEHLKQVNQYFEQNPITVKVNTSEVEDLKSLMDQASGNRTIGVNVRHQYDMQQSSSANTDNAQIVRQLERSLSRMEGMNSTNAAIPNEISNAAQSITMRLDKLTNIVEGFERTSVGNTNIVVKAIANQNKQGFLEKIFDIPKTIIGNVLTGFTEGIGITFSTQLAQGMADYVEAKTGTSFYSAGKGAARFGYNRGKGFGELGASALGYAGGLKEVGKDLNWIAQQFDSFLDPRKFAARIRSLEDLLVGVLEDTTVYNDKRAARARIDNYIDNTGIKQVAQEGASRAAGVGIRAAAQPFRINKRVKLAQSMELAKMLSEQIQVPEIENIDDIKTIGILAGGVDFEGGKNTFFAKPMIERLMGAGTATIPVPNVTSNEKGNMGGLFNLRQQIFEALKEKNPELFKKIGGGDLDMSEPLQFDMMLNVALEAGYNPDAIVMEATRMAYEQKYKGKNFVHLGTSAGTFAAEEATAIAERSGASNVKGAGFTMGLAGLTNTASNRNFRAFVGDLDPLYYGMYGAKDLDLESLPSTTRKLFERSMKSKDMPIPPEMLEIMQQISGILAPSKNTEVIKGTGIAHHLGSFLSEEELQKRFYEFMGDSLQAPSADITGGKAGATFKAYSDMYATKNEGYVYDSLMRSLKVALGDASAIKEVEEGQYSFITPGDRRLRKTYGDSQEKADIEYAFEGISKQSQGKAFGKLAENVQQDVLAFQGVFTTIIEMLKDGGDVDPSKIIEALDVLNKIFGTAPVVPNYKAAPFQRNQFEHLAGINREMGDPSFGGRLNPFEMEVLGEGAAGIIFTDDEREKAYKTSKNKAYDEVRKIVGAAKPVGEEAALQQSLPSDISGDVYEHGRHYSVMELLTGKDVGQQITQQDPAGMLDYTKHMGFLLKRLHEEKTTHGDFHFGNVFDTPDGLKALDFGYAKKPDQEKGIGVFIQEIVARIEQMTGGRENPRFPESIRDRISSITSGMEEPYAKDFLDALQKFTGKNVGGVEMPGVIEKMELPLSVEDALNSFIEGYFTESRDQLPELKRDTPVKKPIRPKNQPIGSMTVSGIPSLSPEEQEAIAQTKLEEQRKRIAQMSQKPMTERDRMLAAEVARQEKQALAQSKMFAEEIASALNPALEGMGEIISESMLTIAPDVGKAIADAIASSIPNNLLEIPSKDQQTVSADNSSGQLELNFDYAKRMQSEAMADAQMAIATPPPTQQKPTSELPLMPPTDAEPLQLGGIENLAELPNPPPDSELPSMQRRINELQKLLKSAQILESARPKQARGMAADAQGYINEALAELNQALESLPPAERMTAEIGGEQLAGLKGQVRRIEESLTSLRERLSADIGNMSDAAAQAVSDYESLLSNNQLDAVTAPTQQEITDRLATLGQTFTQQARAAESPLTDDRQRQAIAKEMIEEAERARAAVETLVAQSDGDERIAKRGAAVRGQITKGVKRAEKIVRATESVGVDVAAGYNEGLESAISSVEAASVQMARASIRAVKDELDIQSPSKVFAEIGRQTGEGLIVGLKSTMPAVEAAAHATFNILGKLGNARQAMLSDKVLQMAKARAEELQNELPDIADSAQHNIVAIGGFAGKSGKTSRAVGDRLQTMLGDSFNIDAVDNVATDTSVDFSQKAKFLWEAITKKLVNELIQGYNPDAIEAAAVAIARKKMSGIDTDFVGYSAGGYPVRQAQRITEQAGLNSKGVAIGTPMLGGLDADPSTFRAFLGVTDLIGDLPAKLNGFLEATQQMLPEAGYQHGLQNYLGHEEFQRNFYKFLGKGQMRPETLNPDLYPTSGLQPFGKGSMLEMSAQDIANPQMLLEAGTDIGAGLAAGIKASQAIVEVAAEEMAQSTVDVTKDVLDIQSPSKVFAEIGANISAGLEGGIDIGAIAGTLMGVLQQAIGAFTAGLTAVSPILAVFVEKILAVVGGIGVALFGALKGAVSLYQQFGDAAVEAAKGNEVLARRIAFSSGSMESAKSIMREITKDANRLGINAITAAEGYANLATATNATPLEGKATEDISSAMNQAASVFNLTAEQADRVNTAIVQMASKGKISAEELRQQMGESLPGAFQVAARAMGVTTQELDKMLQLGAITSDEFLPKFAQQLKAETAIAAQNAADSRVALENRLENARQGILTGVGEAIMPAQNLGLEALLKVLESLNVLVPLVSATMFNWYRRTADNLGVFDALRSALNNALEGIRFTFSSFDNFKMGAGNFATSMKNITQTVWKAVKPIAIFAAETLAIQAAFLVFQAGMQLMGDASGGMKDIVDAATESLDRLIDRLEKAGDSGQNAAASLRDVKVGGAIGGIADFSRSFEIGVTDLLTSILPEETKTRIRKETRERVSGLRSQAEIALAGKQQRDTTFEVERLIEDIQPLYGQASEFMRGGARYGETQRLLEIDNSLERNRLEQANLREIDPGDVRGLRSLQETEDTLLSERDALFSDIGAVGEGLRSTLEQGLNKAVENLEQQLSEGTITQDTFDTNMKALAEEQIVLEETLNAFNASTRDASDSLTELTRAISDSIVKLQSDLFFQDRQFMEEQTRISEAQAAGATPGQIQSMRDDLQIRQAEERRGLFERSVAEQETFLGSGQLQNALEFLYRETGASNYSQIAPADLERVEQREDLDGDVQQAINAIREYQTSSSEIVSLESEIAQVRGEAAERLFQLNREIEEYYRAIQESAEDIALEAKATEIEIAAQEAKARIKGALVGFRESFIAGFADSLIGLIDTLNAPLLEEISAQQENVGLRRQFNDQMRQAQELQRQLPGAIPQDMMNAGAPGAIPGQSSEGGRSDPFATAVSPASFMTGANSAAPFGSGANIPGSTPSAQPGMPSDPRLMEAAQLAQSTLGQREDLLQRRLNASSGLAGVEAELGFEDARNQLSQAREDFSQQSSDFARGLDDIAFGLQETDTPMGQLEANLRQIRQQSQDTSDRLAEFRDGLQATADNARAFKAAIEEGVASGQLDSSFADLIPDLDETIAAAESELSRVSGMETQNRELMMQQELKAREDTEKAIQDEIKALTEQGMQEMEQLRSALEQRSQQVGSAVFANGQSPENATEIINRGLDRLSIAREFNLISNQEAQQFRSAANQIQGLIESGASDRAFVGAALSNEDNEFFGQILSQVGRGDIAELAGLAENPADAVRAGIDDSERLQRIEELMKQQEELKNLPDLSASKADIGALNAQNAIAKSNLSAPNLSILNNNQNVNTMNLDSIALAINNLSSSIRNTPRNINVSGAPDPSGTALSLLNQQTMNSAAASKL